ncbi:MAG: hypothetical protein HC786_04320 [Richelia sp. CSU_2_1]|nr:hypothetical protein [Richelia sp. CSU_2_1]
MTQNRANYRRRKKEEGRRKKEEGRGTHSNAWGDLKCPNRFGGCFIHKDFVDPPQPNAAAVLVLRGLHSSIDRYFIRLLDRSGKIGILSLRFEI